MTSGQLRRAGFRGVGRRSILETVRGIRADSLFRNSAYLLLNLGVTAVFGFVGTLIWTRMYSPEAFGYATAMFGCLGLAVSTAGLGLTRTMARFLGRSTTPANDVTTYLLLFSATSFITGVVFGLGLHIAGIEGLNPYAIAIFVMAAVTNSIKSILDGAFVAMRIASGTLLSNMVFSIVRIVLAVALAGAGYLAIFGTSLVAMIIAVAVSLVLLATKVSVRLPAWPSRSAMRGRWSFALGSYTSDLIGSLPATVLPLIIVGKMGPLAGALWYPVFQIITIMLAVCGSINQAMFAEMSNAQHGMRQFIEKALLSMYALLIPLAAVVVAFAPRIMAAFSPAYTTASNMLRLMAIFTLVGAANYISGSIIAWYRKTFYLTAANAVYAAVTIGYCYFAATDLTGLAVGWIWGEVANSILFVGGCVYFHKSALRKRRTHAV